MNKKRNMDSRERKIVGVVGAAHFYSHFYFPGAATDVSNSV